MTFKIRLHNGKEINASEETTILESAKSSGLALEYSCSNGQCGVCACTLISGEVDVISDSFHSEDEKIANRILTCQSIPRSDVQLNIDDIGIYANYPPKTIPARISSIQKIARDILKLTLRTPPTNSLDYLPGQYLDLIHGSIRRSYSIANAQRKDGTFDLIIKKVNLGKMSEVLFNHTSVNDLFRVEGPLGTFGWRDNLKNKIVFLVTGTGIAPAIAMLNQLNYDHNRILIVWGNRYEDEFFEVNINTNIEMIKVLSRESKDGFSSGYVQNVLLSQTINLSDVTIFACGSDSMIRESKKMLVKHGLDSSQFYSDAFVSSGE